MGQTIGHTRSSRGRFRKDRFLYIHPMCLMFYSLFFTFCLFLVDFLKMNGFLQYTVYCIPLSTCLFLVEILKITAKKGRGVYKRFLGYNYTEAYSMKQAHDSEAMICISNNTWPLSYTPSTFF